MTATTDRRRLGSAADRPRHIKYRRLAGVTATTDRRRLGSAADRPRRIKCRRLVRA